MLKVESTEIADVKLYTPILWPDERGVFFENYKLSCMEDFGLPQFKQDNVSVSKKNVVRGLHIQKEPYSQGKLVSILKGRVYDVSVDLRPSSDTFLKYIGVYLDDKKRKMIYIPPGFAHGFCSLSDENIMLYKNTEEYKPSHETGVLWNDVELNIDWPCKNPEVSVKDNKLPTLTEYLEKCK
jgi:dTDP-4-dehydrorhamnose 3,5-epimerase